MAADWLAATVEEDVTYGMSDHVLSGVVRIVTRSAVFRTPTPPEAALAFAASLRERPTCISIVAGARHWAIFADLVEATEATGNRVPDAYFAALAIESGCEWISFDRGFARYPGLRWRSPLDDA